MLEQRRLDYLAAMGVVQWMPRRALPYAPEPRWLPEAPKNAAAAQSITMPSFVRPTKLMQDAQPAAQVAHVRVEPIAEINRGAAKTEHSPLAAQVADTAHFAGNDAAIMAGAILVPKFHLHFVRSFLPVTWVCDNADDLALVENFAFTVQKAITKESMFLSERMDFRWPFMATAPDSEQALPIALHALRTQWQFINEQGSRGVIAIGQDSQHWLSQIDAPIIFSAPTLNDVFYNAHLKRQLWLALLQVLKG